MHKRGSKAKTFLVAMTLLLLAPLAGCLTYIQVPVRDGAFPRNTIRVGDEVRAQARSGEELSFEVTNFDGTTITGGEGQRVEAGDLASLEVGRMSKKTMYISLGVVGGVLGTAWLLDELDDCDTGLICEYEY
jgi:hypothetical protein